MVVINFDTLLHQSGNQKGKAKGSRKLQSLQKTLRVFYRHCTQGNLRDSQTRETLAHCILQHSEGRPEIQGHPWLQRNFRASLGHLSPRFKRNKNQGFGGQSSQQNACHTSMRTWVQIPSSITYTFKIMHKVGHFHLQERFVFFPSSCLYPLPFSSLINAPPKKN